MPEAVIVATARTPIGRANKGSLTECRPDDLSAHIIKAVLDKVPSLDPQTVEDVIWGCGQPGGEAGYNVARVAALLAGLPDVPGVTVNRYCSSSLQTIRMAAHAIKAGEGDVFVAGGVETVSRYLHGASDTGPHNPAFADAEARTAERTGGADTWEPPAGPPRHLHRDGPDRRERGAGRGRHPRGDGRVGRPLAAAGRRRPGARLLRPGDHAGHPRRRHRGVQGRRPPPRHHRREARRAEAGVPARRQGHRRQRLPAQRRRRRGRRDERHEGRAARPLAARPHRELRRHRPQPGDHGHGPGRGVPPGARPGRPHHRRHRPGGDQRGLRRPGAAVGQAPRHRPREAQPQRRRHRPRPPLRHDRRPHHDHAAQRPRGLAAAATASSRCASAAARAWPWSSSACSGPNDAARLPPPRRRPRGQPRRLAALPSSGAHRGRPLDRPAVPGVPHRHRRRGRGGRRLEHDRRHPAHRRPASTRC